MACLCRRGSRCCVRMRYADTGARMYDPTQQTGWCARRPGCVCIPSRQPFPAVLEGPGPVGKGPCSLLCLLPRNTRHPSRSRREPGPHVSTCHRSCPRDRPHRTRSRGRNRRVKTRCDRQGHDHVVVTPFQSPTHPRQTRHSLDAFSPSRSLPFPPSLYSCFLALAGYCINVEHQAQRGAFFKTHS